MELEYMKKIRSMVALISCWPYHIFGEDVKPLPFRSRYWLFSGRVGLIIGSIVYIVKHFSTTSFFELGEAYLTVFYSIVVLQRFSVSLFKSYDEVMKEFILEMHLLHHRHKTEYSENIYRFINKISSILVTLLRTESFTGAVLYTCIPVYNNFMSGMYSRDRPADQEFEHILKYSIPFINYQTSFPGYLVIAIINTTFILDVTSSFCGFDLVLCVIVFHIWGHLKILDNNLRTLPTPNEMRHQPSDMSDDMLSYTEEENKIIAGMLKEIINHHRATKNFMTKVTVAFGPMLAFYFVFHQVTGCILLLECLNLDSQAVGQYSLMTLTTFQLLVEIAVIVELIGAQSGTLKDAVYSVPWECMNTSNRKMVLFFHMNVQEPIRLKAMGIVPVGVQTMATILKTSFSYFMFLRTLK